MKPSAISMATECDLIRNNVEDCHNRFMQSVLLGIEHFPNREKQANRRIDDQ